MRFFPLFSVIMIMIITILTKVIPVVLEMIAGTERKKTATTLVFHGLERSILFPSSNCAAGRGWW